MTGLKKHRLKSIPIKVGNDSGLWRFASLAEALEANTDLMAQSIEFGKEQSSVAAPVREQGGSYLDMPPSND